MDAKSVRPPVAEPGLHAVKVMETARVVPSVGLPRDINPDHSNNNLDVLRFHGRVYLVWRTAPSHFASKRTRIVIASSEDERHWKKEAVLSLGTDLREPRLLALNGQLRLYVSKLGANPFRFEPSGIWSTVRSENGQWAELRPLDLPGRIAWRVRTVGTKAYMMAYTGGESIYKFDGKPLTVELLTTADGLAWHPVDPDRPAVYTGGGSEADFAIGPEGNLYGVIRNEAGDAGGFGSKVCRAPRDQPSAWSCQNDPRKFDSPLMFTHDGEVYLVARRHVSVDGHYDRRLSIESHLLRSVWNQLTYRVKAKRCSVWRYVQNEQRIAFVLDLPSRGDTCFPSMIRGNKPDELVIYDYSSDVEGPDLPWSVAQNSDTFIYRHVLHFSNGSPPVAGPPRTALGLRLVD